MIDVKIVEIKEIVEHFSKTNIIVESDLKKYIIEKYPEKSEKLYRYYLSDLYKNKIFYRYDVGKLKQCKDRVQFTFSYLADNDIRKVLECINPSIFISYWQLNDLNKFMSLQSFSNIKFIETYSYATEIVVDNLLSINKKVVLEKDYNTFIKYNSNEEIFVVRVINDESPIIRQRCSRTRAIGNESSYIVQPKIEKIFVDIIVDDFFNTILSGEIPPILIELLKKYQINMSTIKRYATKRHNWKLVKDAIESLNFNIEEGEFQWY